jgi:hypothetical protein
MSDNEIPSEELLIYNRKFKKAVLDAMFTVCDTFYIHCMPNPGLFMGKRGLVEKEKTEGIILVFGPYSTRHLSWDEEFIYCEMQFNQWEQVSIPYECIARMFDKNGQVIMQWATLVAPEDSADRKKKRTSLDKGEGREEKTEKREDSRVIKVDFGKKNKQPPEE